uniref:chromophore lyase CpcS/CpeS n=1 Tax=Pyropia dentata TaxID=76160 RepID=UPI00286D03AD|nr:chromophore lyase CpcS/CpeS [Neoporphyra dentata]WKD83783.1 chromophore lyase CpcS/CpeS [Neoporphyra dentata]
MKNLISFFDRSKGKWISQRTTYELHNKNMSSAQSQMQIKSCNLLSGSTGLASLNWGEIFRQVNHNSYSQDTSKHNDKFNLEFSNQLNNRKLLTLCTVTDPSLINFKTRYGSTTVDETYWFATSKLRLSTSIIKKFDTCVAVSFCSEIKV